jgi:hypothetical protein
MSGLREAELIGVLEKQLALLEKIAASIDEAYERDLALIGRNANAAVMIAGLIENFYTCLESAFMKISQHFENHLDPSRWHAELLAKMTLRIEGVRIPALSDESLRPLQELQRFRHFKRYYFDLEYDWDRLDYLHKKLRDAHPRVREDLLRFIDFLRRI